MKQEQFTFENASGQKLSAKMIWPANLHPHAFAIFAHCFTCNKNLNAVRNISNALAGRGYGVLSFDFTGLGNSEGDFAETTFTSNIKDLIAAANFLSKEFSAPQLLVGHSLGGAAVLAAAMKIDSVKAVATIGAPSEAGHVQQHFSEALDKIQEKGKAEVNIGGRPFYIGAAFIEDISEHNSNETIRLLRTALLVLHSPQDKIVKIENAAKIYEAAHHPKSFVSLDGADHLLSNAEDSHYAGNIIASWADRYVENKQSQTIESESDTAAIIGRSDEGFTTLIKTGKHYITADEPADVGGNDYGPSPYQLLSASLAACTAMTLRMYADKKKWDIDQIQVSVNHEKRHVEDSQKQDNQAKIDHFDRKLDISGNIDDEQRRKLLEIADKCPVHRTLEGDIKIDTGF